VPLHRNEEMIGNESSCTTLFHCNPSFGSSMDQNRTGRFVGLWRIEMDLVVITQEKPRMRHAGLLGHEYKREAGG
jgi:hypothetical protein